MESEKSKYENFKHEIDFNQYIPITDEKTIKEFNQLEKPPDNIIKKPGKYKKVVPLTDEEIDLKLKISIGKNLARTASFLRKIYLILLLPILIVFALYLIHIILLL